MLLLILYCYYCSITMVWYIVVLLLRHAVAVATSMCPSWRRNLTDPRRVGHVHDCIYGHCHVAPWASDLVRWCWAERCWSKQTPGDLKRHIPKDDFWDRLKLMGGFEFCTMIQAKQGGGNDLARWMEVAGFVGAVEIYKRKPGRRHIKKSRILFFVLKRFSWHCARIRALGTWRESDGWSADSTSPSLTPKCNSSEEPSRNWHVNVMRYL